MGADLSRRRVLSLGTAGSPDAGVITIGPACFAARGIVCQSCADHCPAGAIRFRPRIGAAPEPRLDGERCTGCGACVPVCPAGAIRLQAAHA